MKDSNRHVFHFSIHVLSNVKMNLFQLRFWNLLSPLTFFQERIGNLNEEELRGIMRNACRRQPSFVFNLLEVGERGEEPSLQLLERQ